MRLLAGLLGLVLALAAEEQGRAVEKCAGCTSVVDRMYQAVLKAVPGEKTETSLVELFETFCDDFQYYSSLTLYNTTLDQEFSYYRPPTEATEATPDGRNLYSFCQNLYEENEEMLEAYALSLNKASSQTIQLELCVERMHHCTEVKARQMAITFVHALRAANMDPRKLKSTTRQGNGKGKKKKKKKNKKQKGRKAEL
jgi:hypothetical protein